MKIKSKLNNAVILLAGGRGERMGGNYKQFVKIHGKPIIFYSLEKFIACPFFKEIIIVVPKEKLDFASKIISKHFRDTNKKITLVKGGTTRRWSAYNALNYLKNKKERIDYIIFHDVSRPLISLEMIRTVLNEAKENGAAIVGLKAIDLIFEGDKKKFISRAFNKEKMYYGYTPQCFKFDQIWEAHYKTKNIKSLDLADNIELLKKLNKQVKIKIIDKFYPNFKITYKPDFKIINTFLK